MPPVRLAPRAELAAAARVVPLLRAARELRAWIAVNPEAARRGVLDDCDAVRAAEVLELSPDELTAAWQVVAAAQVRAGPDQLTPGGIPLASAAAQDVLHEWDTALAALLDREALDGLATALYTVGAPVRIDALFDAYSAAAGSAGRVRPQRREPTADDAGDLSRALEILADLGVVELGTEETTGGLTVGLSPLGVWGVHRRLLAQGWHVPVLGAAEQAGAVGLLTLLASCDAEDGESRISAWLVGRPAQVAAAELIAAAADGTPGLRGAAFAVLDRIGKPAAGQVRAALREPLLRAHAAVWLHEHGEDADLGPADRAWLLVDLGAGLLEEADPRDVVAELLPDVAADAQAEIVAGLWEVRHPALIDLLTTLSDHHPEPRVARAARKAAFKARSAGTGQGAGQRPGPEPAAGS
jgi:hypothetical protein